MRRTLLAGVLVLLTIQAGPVRAGQYGDALGRCAIGATTAADRTALLRWSFLIAAGNPALSDLSSATPEMRARASRTVGELFNRIVLRDCRGQSIEALRREGEEGLASGFQALAQIAAEEMMQNEAGAAALEELMRHLDTEALEALAAEAAAQPPI